MTTRLKTFSFLITVLSLALGSVLTVPAARAQYDVPQLRILFNSSVQANVLHCGCKSNPMGGLARRGALVQRLARDADAFVLLDGGNLLPAANSDDMAHVEFLAEATAQLGYQAVGIGPHDLARGMAALTEVAAESGLHFVSANLEAGRATGFATYRVLQRGDLRIAFTSVVAPELLDSMPAEDPAASLAQLLPELHARADLVVLACSLPPGQTIALVESLDPATAPDLVIEAYGGAHLARARRIGRTTLVAANSRGKYLGQVDFTRSGGGEWTAEYTLHALTLDLPEDPKLAAAVAALDLISSKPVPYAR